MPESEQKYEDFQKNFRESTTTTLKKLEIQNEILKIRIDSLQKGLFLYKVITFTVASISIVSCGIIVGWLLL
jgi:hypothetical protein